MCARLPLRLSCSPATHPAHFICTLPAVPRPLLPRVPSRSQDLGDGVAAESYYRQALALRPRFAGCLSNLANLLREKGELEEALRLYDAAIEAEPSFADPHNNRGNCLKDMGRFDDAVAAYQRAIAMRPEFPDAYGNCAAAYKDKGDLDSAIVLYRKALSFKPRDRPDPIPFCNYLHCMQVRARTSADDRWERCVCGIECHADGCG